MDDVIPRLGVVKRPSSSLIPGTKNNAAGDKKEGFPISFRHLGKGGYEITLYAGTQGSRKKWLEHIGEQQAILRARGNFYNKTIVSNNYFTASNRVNCVAPFGKIPPRLLYHSVTEMLQMVGVSLYTVLILEYLSRTENQKMQVRSRNVF